MPAAGGLPRRGNSKQQASKQNRTCAYVPYVCVYVRTCVPMYSDPGNGGPERYDFAIPILRTPSRLRNLNFGDPDLEPRSGRPERYDFAIPILPTPSRLRNLNFGDCDLETGRGKPGQPSYAKSEPAGQHKKRASWPAQEASQLACTNSEPAGLHK